jgi:tol-pal system protein YbgF
MISQRFTKPVLVAGFFIFTAQVAAQGYTVQPADSPSSIVPYVQADTSGVPEYMEPTVTAGSDARSLALRVQQLEEEIRRLNEVEDGSLASDESVVTGDSETPTNVPKEPEVGEQEAYQAAYGLVRERQFSEALTAFSEFLNAYPFGRFAPNAHYWLGELYLVVEPVDPEAARQNFQVLLDQYPNDRKVPDALYKLGRVHALKGNAERSRSYLDRVIAEYGAEGHPAAQLAQDFIDSQ